MMIVAIEAIMVMTMMIIIIAGTIKGGDLHYRKKI
jgi:hypothetical protein